MRHYGIFPGPVAVMLLAAACTTADEPTSTPTATPPGVVPTATPTSMPPDPTSTATPTGVSPAPTATPTEESMTEGDMGMMGPSGDLVLSLHDMNDSGQSGIAVLTANGNQTDVTIIATTGISELNHIHAGSCMDLGGVSYPLTSMVNGTSVTTVDASLDTLTSGDLAINLHKAGDPGTYTACTEIPVKDMMGAAQTLEVIIASFILPDLNVTLGTTVTWANQDGAPHTTTSGQNGQFAGPGWNSDQLLMGQTFSHTFDQVGTFAYTCRIHPSMNGTVTVSDPIVSSSSGTQVSGSGDPEY